MMVNPYEPATTIWELMDAPAEGPGMNSRNHHMFSSVGQSIVEQFGGIAQQPSSVTHFITNSYFNHIKGSHVP
jgi:hypothetical protein